MHLKLLFGSILFIALVSGVSADFSVIVKELELEALRNTFDEVKVNRLLNGKGKSLDTHEKQSAALLVSIGILAPADLAASADVESKIQIFRRGVQGKSKYLIGPFNDSVTLARLDEIEGHKELLEEKEFIAALHKRLNDGVLTGYDLRPVNVAAGFDQARTFIYSHASRRHIKQLTALLASEGVGGLLYVMPKISAFLFREGWGEPPSNVSSLENGQLVINGREWVVFFEFAHAKDKQRFHQLVTRYAKKDDENEKGLIAGSWWQPFYYSGTTLTDFEHINLIILKSEKTEATLTVLPEKLDFVMSALGPDQWNMDVEDVWVNKPFFRFLNGGFR